MLFRTQVNFAVVSTGYIWFAEVGSLLSLNRAWRAQVTHAYQYISKITSGFTKTTFYFITFYSRKYYLEARSQGGNGGKMTQFNTISKPVIMPPGL